MASSNTTSKWDDPAGVAITDGENTRRNIPTRHARLRPVVNIPNAPRLVYGPNFPTYPEEVVISRYYPSFDKIVGDQVETALLLAVPETMRLPLFTHGCCYIKEADEVYISSGMLRFPEVPHPFSQMTRVKLVRAAAAAAEENAGQQASGGHSPRDITTVVREAVPLPFLCPSYAIPVRGGLVVCALGSMGPPFAHAGGLYYFKPAIQQATKIVTSYCGMPFNAVQSVVQDNIGGLWFVDAVVDFHDAPGRPETQLPSIVYHYNPAEHIVSAVTMPGELGYPKGIAISPDNRTIYVADMEGAGGRLVEPALPGCIYAFQITGNLNHQGLANKRHFATASLGAPSTVHCDKAGNVYAACGCDIEVWNADGLAIGSIEIPGGTTSFCFGREDELFITAAYKLWRVQLNPSDPSSPPAHPQIPRDGGNRGD